MRVYLAGPINGCTDEECRDWREYVKTRLPLTIDPMVRDYRGIEDEKWREIVEGDKADIDRCHVVLVNYDKPSVGTAMEILYAWERNKPVVVVAKPGTRISPWLRFHSWDIVDSFEKAIVIILTLEPGAITEMAECTHCGRTDVPVCPQCNKRVPHGFTPGTWLPCLCQVSFPP